MRPHEHTTRDLAMTSARRGGHRSRIIYVRPLLQRPHAESVVFTPPQTPKVYTVACVPPYVIACSMLAN